jgi:hypothetical protein
MRIGQLETLTEDELALLLYIVNVIEPLGAPQMEITAKQLLWFKHDSLVWKVVKQESKLTPEGKEIFKSLMTKLNTTAQQEAENYASSSRPTFEQSNFQF